MRIKGKNKTNPPLFYFQKENVRGGHLTKDNLKYILFRFIFKLRISHIQPVLVIYLRQFCFHLGVYVENTNLGTI